MGIVRLPVITARRPGYVIDHVKAVKDGGAHEPWQTGKDDHAAHALGLPA